MATIAPQPDNGMDKKPPHPEPPRADGDAPDDQRVYPREIEYPDPGAIKRVEEIETGVGLNARRSRALAKVIHDAVREGLKQQNREMRQCFRAVYNMVGRVGEDLGGRIDRLEKRHDRADERHDKAERKADERHAEAERKADERFDKLGKEIADSRRFTMWLFGLMATLAVGALAILVHHFDSALDRMASLAQSPPALVAAPPSPRPSGGEEVQAGDPGGNAGAMPEGGLAGDQGGNAGAMPEGGLAGDQGGNAGATPEGGLAGDQGGNAGAGLGADVEQPTPLPL